MGSYARLPLSAMAHKTGGRVDDVAITLIGDVLGRAVFSRTCRVAGACACEEELVGVVSGFVATDGGELVRDPLADFFCAETLLI